MSSSRCSASRQSLSPEALGLFPFRQQNGEADPGNLTVIEDENYAVVVSRILHSQIGNFVLELLDMLVAGDVQLSWSALIDRGPAGSLDPPLLGEGSLVITPCTKNKKSCNHSRLVGDNNLVVQTRMQTPPAYVEKFAVDHLCILQPCPHRSPFRPVT